ncbi:MAG: rhomboid family intramembrane serine protease [Planctomycetes bacterium]|nr:rhomboid family intramembrane serine protease [Planctomycetota bacterium]MCB9886988.1 rhomboid family intramembrane serine protease [Planctomycetota bacterium]
MKDLLQHADEIPVTLVVALAYATVAILTGSIGLNFADSEKLFAWGSLAPMDAPLQPWRLLSYAFVHANLVHLVFNLSFLLNIGPALERSMGSLKFLALYVVAAIGSGVAVCLLYEVPQPVVGGSGALFGMMGALVAWNMHSGRHLFAFLEFEGPRRLMSMIVANLVIGFLIPFVSNTGHIGGLITGFAVTFLFLTPVRRGIRSRRPWQIAIAALFASLTFACIVPVWRWDWLYEQGLNETGARRQSIERAVARSISGDQLGEQIDPELAHLYYQQVGGLLETLRKRRGG